MVKIDDFEEIIENDILFVESMIENNYSCCKFKCECTNCPFRITNIKYLIESPCLTYNEEEFGEFCEEFLKLAKEHLYNKPKLSVQNPIRPACNDLYELKIDTTSINMDTNKASLTYKLVDNSVEKCITNYPRLLGLMQYGLFITQMDGHLYIDVNYECVTSESEELQNKIKDKGITFISKVYEGYDEALDRVDNLLEALGLKKLSIVGNYLIELKKQEE
jgi:hypothetical protein